MKRRGVLNPIPPAKHFAAPSRRPKPPQSHAQRHYDEWNTDSMQPDYTHSSGFGLISGHLVDLRPRTDLAPEEEEFAEMLDEAVSNLTTSTAPDLRINAFGNSLEEEEDEDDEEDQDDTPTLSDEDSEITATAGTESASTSPAYTAKLAVAEEDPEFIDPSKIAEEAKGTGKVNSFILALGIYATSMDISTTQYSAMMDLFNYVMLEPSVVRQFPKSLSTLKKYMRSVLPLQTIKAHHFRPDTDQLPPQTQTPSNAYYFDIKEIASIWLSDKSISEHLYTGLGEFVDEFQEYWQADAWLESIRTSSGEFARLENGNGTHVIPSDCVWYTVPGSPQEHLGRVCGVGYDRRSSGTGVGYDRRSSGTGKVSIAINPLLQYRQLPQQWKEVFRKHRPKILQDTPCEQHTRTTSTIPLHTKVEVSLMEDMIHIVPLDNILRHESVFFLDYDTPSACNQMLPEDLSDAQATNQSTRQVITPKFYVACIMYTTETATSTETGLRSIEKRHRLIAELELLHYGRNELLNNNQPFHSLPYTTFLDGFGLYRNSYHALAGVYITPSNLPLHLREKIQNIFVLMLGPFGSSETDISAALRTDCTRMDKGTTIKLLDGSGSKFVRMFCIAHHGDMPQQNKLAGVKSHRADYGCRGCFASKDQFGNLTLDIKAQGRYLFPMKKLQKDLQQLKTKTAQDRFSQKVGISTEGPLMASCHPCLDPIRSTPHDPLHAECRICKYFQSCLVESFGTTGELAYRLAWEKMELPYKWGRPQNPISHKGSMNFSEHARIACLNPFILMRVFSLPGDHFRPSVERDLASLLTGSNANATPRQQVYDNFIFAAYQLALAVHLTFKSTITAEERAKMTQTVLQARTAFQWIVKGLQSSAQVKNKWKVPNVHIPLHYQDNVRTYGTTRNSACSMGEKKHKYFKQHAPHTNSKENDLQLLQAVNLSQTLRYTIDGLYKDHPVYRTLNNTVNNIMEACPRIRHAIIPQGTVTPLAESTNAHRCSVDYSDSSYNYAKVGKKKTARQTQQSQDIALIALAYEQMWGTDLRLLGKWNLRHWGSFTAMIPGKHHQNGEERQKIYAGTTFVRVHPKQFALVQRIFTVEVGQLTRVLFQVVILRRNREEEFWAAPYEVYTLIDPGGGTLPSTIVNIVDVLPGRYHFVSKIVGESWYWNNLLVHTG